jgi:hypothetical protein
MLKIPLLLEFKINQKVFSFNSNFSNKRSRVQLLEYNKASSTIFGFFYEFLWILQVGCFEFERDTAFSQIDPWKDLNRCN